MFKVIRDLLKYDGRFRIAFVFLSVILIMVFLSFVSPYDPSRTFQVPADHAAFGGISGSAPTRAARICSGG